MNKTIRRLVGVSTMLVATIAVGVAPGPHASVANAAGCPAGSHTVYVSPWGDYPGCAKDGQAEVWIHWACEPNQQCGFDHVVVGSDWKIYDGQQIYGSIYPWYWMSPGAANPHGGGIFFVKLYWNGNGNPTRGYLRVYGTDGRYYCRLGWAYNGGAGGEWEDNWHVDTGNTCRR